MNTLIKFGSLIAVALMFFTLPAFASADACHDGTPHVRTVQATVPVCIGNTITCDPTCECAPGFTRRGVALANGDPNCVRNLHGDANGDGYVSGSYQEPLCALGAVRGRNGECDCPASLGARQYRDLTVVSREFAATIADQIEDYASLRRGTRPIALQICTDGMATRGSNGSLSDVLADALERRLTAVEGRVDGIADLIRNFRPSTVVIHYGDRDYTAQTFVDERLVPIIGEIQNRLQAVEGRVGELETEVHEDIVPRIEALEAREPGSNTLRSSLSPTHARLGAVGRLGFLTPGPATGVGAASGEIIYRFGETHVGLYGRVEFGAQETAAGVGGSLYLSGGAGLAFFAGGRHSTTVSLGIIGEDLLAPFADDPHGVLGSEVGVALGAELSVSVPISDTVRLRLGLALAYGERSSIVNDQFTTTSGVYLAPSIGLEFQPDL